MISLNRKAEPNVESEEWEVKSCAQGHRIGIWIQVFQVPKPTNLPLH